MLEGEAALVAGSLVHLIIASRLPPLGVYPAQPKW